MSENKAAAYGIYPRHIPLPEVAHSLNQAGFDNEDICMVLSPAHPVAQVVRDANMLSFEHESTALRARMIGWVSEFGAVLIPSVGFFIRSHTYLRALAIEQDSFSGESDTLTGLGFSKDDAERLDHKLWQDVGVLVYVSCPEGSKNDQAVELLRQTGACEAASLRHAQAVAA
ncbi:MAG TPA: hypothetical protein VMG31_02820 [Verrucomicrobiae bacterium]|nr:hypothetical protein [Verrucomicrobiae bacterium]